jgi:hypothetical protein
VVLQLLRKARRYQGTASQAAKKLVVEDVLKGRGFSRTGQVFYSCHSERASAREESAFSLFQQPVQACRK